MHHLALQRCRIDLDHIWQRRSHALHVFGYCIPQISVFRPHYRRAYSRSWAFACFRFNNIIDNTHVEHIDNLVGLRVDHQQSILLMHGKDFSTGKNHRSRLPIIQRTAGISVGLVVVTEIRVARTLHLTFNLKSLKIEHPDAVARRHIPLFVGHSAESTAVALPPRGVDNLKLLDELHCLGVGHRNASAHYRSPWIFLLFGNQIHPSVPYSTILIRAAQFLSGILRLHNPVAPIIAVYIIGQQVIDR